ncbi:MAG: hypothetical protein ACPIOQ_74410, partial [Promethearchaeia archaeon]
MDRIHQHGFRIGAHHNIPVPQPFGSRSRGEKGWFWRGVEQRRVGFGGGWNTGWKGNSAGWIPGGKETARESPSSSRKKECRMGSDCSRCSP